MYRIMVDIKSRKPIYEQLVESVKTSVVKGFMKPDEALPSVRQLAGELAINPNTIQKAYAELERQGIVYSVPGKGSFVCSEVGDVRETHKKELLSELEKAAERAQENGLTKEEITDLINRIWR